MAAYAGLASLLNNIEQMMAHPRLSTSLDKNQIRSLHGKADNLLKFIINSNYGVGSKEAEDLERQIARAAHAAEDVIESHIVDQIHAGSNQASLVCSLDLKQTIEEMDAIMKKAAEVEEKWRLREEQPTHHEMDAVEEKATEKQPLTTGETSSVGLEDDVIDLMDKLTKDQPKLHTISIVGMGGTGKTTLAQNVYQNSFIKQHFDIRAWATISQQYSAQEILSQLLSGQGKSGNDFGLELHKLLFGRRYLIILDDIWSVKAWEELLHSFPDNDNGSRIVLTTRLSDVASGCGSSSCFTMKPLDENKSWVLFCKKAFEKENCPYPELEKVGNKIARLCKGLPLSIVVIGGLLLKSPRTVRFWDDFAKNIKSIPNSKEKQESLDVLSLSYNHLPPHLKPCFLYMGVFKEDSEIRVSTIIKLWVAEGFLRPNGPQVLEEIAEDYLKNLISRNLVLVDKPRDNGKIGSCRIHDLLRDLCLKLGEQQDFFHEIEGGTGRRLLRDYFTYTGGGNPLLRSVIGRTRLEEQIVKYRLLRVLEGGFFRSPKELFGNVNLRYLAYQQQPYELPTSLPLMWYLQTLSINKITSSSSVVVAPIGIWKMRQLRHVMCSKIYFPHPPPSSGQDYMENLQTLTTAINLRLSEEVCKLIPNIKKLHLIYDGELDGYDDSLVECLCNLDRLHRLETLQMEIKGSKWPTKNTEQNKKLAFPSSLNKLSLSWCQLHWDDLRVIGSLPQLQVLKLGRFSVTRGRKWSPVNGQFLNLKLLKIECCGLIVDWDADDSLFPKLEKLCLSQLYSLKEITLDIGDIPTLELIRVDLCSESAAISAMRIKGDQLDKGNDALQIQVMIYRSQLKSFMKMVEIEGLTINDIQLDTIR